MSILSLLWTCGTTLSWAAIDVFVSLGTSPTNLVPVRIPRFMLGIGIGGGTIHQRAGGVSSTALGMRSFAFIMRLLRYCPDAYMGRVLWQQLGNVYCTRHCVNGPTSKSDRTPTSTNLFTLMLPLCNKNLMGDGRRASSSKSPTKSPVAKSLKGSLSRGIISFGKVLALSLKLMPMHERRRSLKGANLLLLCIHLPWIRVALFATPPFYF